MLRYSLICSVIVLLLRSVGAAETTQQLTIPEAVARMAPGPYVTSRITEVAPRPFEEAVRDADLIVHASLRKLTTYLSPDQRELFTDYEVLPMQVVAARKAHTAKAPGLHRLVLRQWGGETVLNGVPVKIYDQNFPMLPTDTPLLLLLSFNEEIGKYQILGTITGAFEVDAGGKVRHLVRRPVPYYDRLNGADLANVIAEIRQHRP